LAISAPQSFNTPERFRSGVFFFELTVLDWQANGTPR